jgi:hypothetical protein
MSSDRKDIIKRIESCDSTQEVADICLDLQSQIEELNSIIEEKYVNEYEPSWSEPDYERPPEPFSESEDPEQWCRVLAWEEQRADKLQAQVERLEDEVKHLKHVCPDCGYAGSNLHKLPDFHCTQCGFESEQAKDEGGSGD